MRTLLDLRGNIPTFIDIPAGRPHDVNVLDRLLPEAGAFYIMDRACPDFERLHHIHPHGGYFALRARRNTQLRRLYSRPVDRDAGVVCDRAARPAGRRSSIEYPDRLRRIRYHDRDRGKTFVFLTDNLVLPPLTFAAPHHCGTVSRAMAGRVVLQVDQAASPDKIVSGNVRQCRQNANLDRSHRSCACGHHQETTRL